MPKNTDIKKVLVIGSGPIVIGQAAEFDYAGVQACRALKEDGIEIVLVNSNPATIMTDKIMADKVYIEPLTLTTVERIIKKEKPDSILSGLGGQTGLTLSMQLAKSGFLEENNVRLLGSFPETIDKAEDRQLFKDTMEEIGQPCIPSKVVTEIDAALEFAEEIGYPVIVRPAFTLGGSGGGIANNVEELKETARTGIEQSPINQILVERCIAGWKEVEFEVMRDHAGNVITVCSMENFDPVGVHTGDSIVIAPAITLADKEFQMLRSAACDIITALGVEGGCNCQFALNPDSFEYAVIEVNPRVSRSSALASKATGYPIAKVATKIALGYTLDEIMNAVTGTTYAAFEPAIDYVAIKFPKWPFDKFVYAKRSLGTQMKATGEVMSISDSFESGLMKAVRGAEISLKTLRMPITFDMTTEELYDNISEATDQRLFFIYELLMRGEGIEKIHDITKIDNWFLNKLVNIADYEKAIEKKALTKDEYYKGKKLGFLDESLEEISGNKMPCKITPTYKMVDTCSGEFEAQTPYFYATYNSPESGGENEALQFLGRTGKDTIIVLGSGPIRIGQGIEFDYASVHSVKILKEMGYEVVIINNNPETVSTDFDIGDRLYFEPLCDEDVMNIIEMEKPVGVVASFGGGTAIKLTKCLAKNNIPIVGTSADSIDMAEDRERFDELLERLGVIRPKGYAVMTREEAFEVAHKLTFPVLMRPSYVLGGQNMVIAWNDEDIDEYMDIILAEEIENPVLIDKYVEGREIEVDAVYDGKDVLLPGIMEHVERAGIHSGDSIAMYPAQHIDDDFAERLVDTTKKMCEGLDSIGIINIQYILKGDDLYVLEVNPRASRTVPYLSKVTGIPMVDLAIRVSLGEKLKDMGYGTGIYKLPPHIAVKVPVFSFEKLIDVDTQLGPEMKSTGEVLGIGKNIREALFKGLVAAGYKMYKKGGVLITVRKTDQHEVADIGRKFAELGFELYATEGTARSLEDAGLEVTMVNKIHESDENTMTLLESGKINYIISTSAKGRLPAKDSVKLRRRAVALGIPCMTSIDTANALADCLRSTYSEYNTTLFEMNNMSTVRKEAQFIKMQGCGNDYILFDCFESSLDSPESLAVDLLDRHYGIGGEGIVIIEPSKIADAKIRIFNRDGSEGPMGGNAIRCVGKYLHDMKGVYKTRLDIETLSGIKNLKLITRENQVIKVEVDMGKAVFTPSEVPVAIDGFTGDKVLKEKVSIAGSEYEISCVNVGNPHCVVYVDNVDALNLEEIGPLFENDKIFPERVNTEFVQVIDEETLKMRVWERGSGETWACGTGACAAVSATVANGMAKADKRVRVMLVGGDLEVKYTEDTIYMRGGCSTAFKGIVEV